MLGKQGKFEGKDYRDVEVLADLLPIPGSPWFMVAKVDAEEIFAEARYRAIVIVVIVGSFILLAAAATAYVYRRRQTRFFRDLYESERQQRKIQETFRITLYSIGDAVITTDTGGRVREMNPVAETLTGWPETEARGKPLEETFRIVNEETRATVENPVNRVLREGTVVGLANHTLLVARDGTERPIADSAAPIRDENGIVIGVVLVFRDQTEERTAQGVLIESEERLRLALTAANQGLYDLNVQTGECIVSPEYARMLGYDPAEFRETNDAWRERLHPDDREEVYRTYEDYVAGRRDEYRVEFRQRTQSGDWKWILSLGSLISRSADGQPLRMLGTHTDITERKRAEETVRQSQKQNEFLASVIQQSSQPFAVGYPDGRLGLFNKAFRATYVLQRRGAAPTRLGDSADARRNGLLRSGRAWRSFIGPASRCGTRRSTSARTAAACQSSCWCTLARDAEGNPEYYYTFLTDITERKQAEEALRDSERFLRSTLDGLSANIALLDEQGKILLVNKAWREFAEKNGIISVSAVSQGANYLQICDSAYGESSEEAGPFAEGIRAVLSGVKESYVLEYPCHSPDKKRWFVGRITPFPGDGPRRVVVAHEDITERIKAEDELRESWERYRLVADFTYDWEYWVNPEGKFLYVSPSCERVSGYQPDFFLNDPDALLKIVHPEDRCKIESHINDPVVRGSDTDKIQFRIITQTGETRWIDHKCWAIFSQEGAFKGRRGSNRDITQRLQLENQLRQAQKMEAVGRLAGGVAHDFNNMLGVILGFTDLAITKLPADDPIQMYLDEVKSAAQRSADITRQLLAFARKQTIAPKVLDLNDTIASMLKMLRRLIGEDIDLLWKPANDLWPVKMDPAQIDQILANLMVNSRDAIAGVGKITIETGKVEFDEHYCESHVGFVPGRYVLLAVSDDGCGMDKETLAKLFEPFFTTKEVGKGTGLGLATIYGIVKQNNGFINVYSEPGIGTTFKIYLPRQEPQEATSEQPRKPAEVPTGTETVLLVEDEKSLLKFARMLLEELGYTVLAAGSPREAIQLAKEYTNEIHLLMTDVVMPEMSGRDLCVQLEASQPGLKCLYMSGYTANVIAHHGVLDEELHFLQKPFSRAALATKMREALS